MDKISFKGYKNILILPLMTEDCLKERGFRLVAQVTDDITPDLTNFKSVLKGFPDEQGDDFIRVDYDAFKDDKLIHLNGRPVYTCRQNTDAFTQIARFCKCILSANSISYDGNYINSLKRLIEFPADEPEHELIELTTDEVNAFQWQDKIKRIASMINQEIKIKMNKHFGLEREEKHPIESFYEPEFEPESSWEGE